ncbi:MAG: FAD-linked oxidase C-terminal domain-containing protein [Veillonellaceae bacterium]|nr:FAD-linked oxidase C-terminal domain-containing protein [Veillonellaceae bacterium]
MPKFPAYTDDEIIAYLKEQVKDGQVFTDQKTLERHSFSHNETDESSALALAYIEVGSKEDIQGVLQMARKFHLPVIPQSSFSSLVIGADGEPHSLIVSTNRLNRIIEINKDDLIAVVEPGVINNTLDQEARKQGLFYAPDPGSRMISRIGGNVATNAGGMSTVKYGTTRDNVLGIKVILPDGRDVTLGHRTYKQAFGYDLTHLFIGSEGTLGIVYEVTVKLMPIPLGDSMMGLAFFKDMPTCAKAISAIRRSGLYPVMLEALDANSIEALDIYNHTDYKQKGAGAMLIFKIDVVTDKTQAALQAILQEYEASDVTLAKEEKEQERLLQMRRDYLLAVYALGGNHVMEDMCVPLSQLPTMVAYIRQLEKEYGYKIYVAGHAGDGNVHPTILWPKEEKETPQAVVEIIQKLFRKALEVGGTISGEHATGMLKGLWNNEELGDDLDMLQHQIKSLIDPMNIMNPKRKID